MSKKNEVISPFMINYWRILSFSSSNSLTNIPSDIEHNWVLQAHVDYLHISDDYLDAILQIRFCFYAENDGKKMSMEGLCAASCRMEKNAVQNSDKVFNDLLSRTAMMNCLANLRVFLLQSGILLQMGPKSTMLPFVNLNGFEFDKEIVLSS